MGDVIVKGASAPSATSVKDRTFGWTKTSFKTEEIGLVNPNLQFIIKHVFLIKVLDNKGNSTLDSLAKQMAKFEAPAPLSVLTAQT
jgi:hypothetical protein